MIDFAALDDSRAVEIQRCYVDQQVSLIRQLTGT